MAEVKKVSFATLASVSMLVLIELFARVAGSVKGDIERGQLAAPEEWLIDSPK
jgi:hypothetical protein